METSIPVTIMEVTFLAKQQGDRKPHYQFAKFKVEPTISEMNRYTQELVVSGLIAKHCPQYKEVKLNNNNFEFITGYESNNEIYLPTNRVYS